MPTSSSCSRRAAWCSPARPRSCATIRGSLRTWASEKRVGAFAARVPARVHRLPPRRTTRPETGMKSLLKKLSPTVTNLIRIDHTHVLAAFHQYQADTRPQTKQALVNTISLALEIHAQLEEE